MAASDAAFTGSVPALYHRCLGPLLFQPYDEEVARRVAAIGPARILETAAGTGIVTEALAAALPDAEIEARHPARADDASSAAAEALLALGEPGATTPLSAHFCTARA